MFREEITLFDPAEQFRREIFRSGVQEAVVAHRPGVIEQSEYLIASASQTSLDESNTEPI